MASSVPGKRESSLRIRVAPEGVSFSAWPLRERPLRSWGMLVVVAALSGLVGRFAPSAWFGWLTLVALLFCCWRVWLPVQFEINSKGVVETVLWRSRRIPWTAIAQHEIYREGVLLLPDVAANALSPLRGLYIPWNSRRHEVLANLEYYLAPWSGDSRSASRPASH